MAKELGIRDPSIGLMRGLVGSFKGKQTRASMTPATKAVTAGMGAVSQGGTGGGTSIEGLLGKGKGGIKSLFAKLKGQTGWAKAIQFLMIYLALQKGMELTGDIAAAGTEAESFKRMSEQITPESLAYQSMLPAQTQRAATAQAALMQQMLGGGQLPQVQAPQLATGEEIIGGGR